MELSGQWRTSGDRDTVLIVEDSRIVREAMGATPALLSRLLTVPGDLGSWHGGIGIDEERRNPDGWGRLVIDRAESGEVITMDPELFWNGIYRWFRSRGVDFDSQRG